MKKLDINYYRTFFGTWRYFRAVGVIALVGILCLYFAIPMLWSSAQYYFDNLAITEAEEAANIHGWTNKRTATVKELKENREAKAQEDEVYAWCMSSGKTNFGARVRKAQIVSHVIFIVFGLIAILYAVSVVKRDVQNYIRLIRMAH